MRNQLKLAVLFLVMGSFVGCSMGKVSQLEKTSEQQTKYIKELMDIMDRNSATIKETGTHIEQLDQRLNDLETRLAVTQTDKNAEMQEIKENIAFVGDQLSRMDKSLQSRRPAPLPKGASAFKPGGFNIGESYQAALEDYKSRQYEAAISGFKEVLTISPQSSLADNAQYWIGECYDALGKYDEALDAFNKVFDFPESNKLPDAHVKIGVIYAKTGKNDAAKQEFEAVITNYPGTDAAKIASSQLSKLGN